MKLNLSSILSALSTNLKDPESGRGRKLLRAALIILVIFFLIIGGMTISGLLSRDAGALALMPAPDESAPYAMLTIANGELPAEIFKLLLDSPTVFPSGNSPVITLLPVFKTAESSALVISERENNFVMYGSLKLNGEELSSLSSVKLPEKWKRLLTLPELSRADKDGVIRLTAANLDSPLYIELHDGSKRLGSRQILDGMSLRVQRGMSCVLMGPSGSGKSVTLKHVIGILRPDTGSVQVDGQEVPL